MSFKSPPSTLTLATLPRELHLNILTFLRATDLSVLQLTARCFNNRDLIAEVVNHCAHVVYPSDLTEGFDTPIVSGEVSSVAVVTNADTVAFFAKKKMKKGVATKKTIGDEPAATSSSTSSTTIVTTAPPAVDKVYTYEMLRNMEMLVVARVLSRPEPPVHERNSCFYVSKSWCRAALKWLEVQEEERKELDERRRLANEAKNAATPKKGGGGQQQGKGGHGSSGKKKLSRKEQKQRDRRMSDSLPPWSNINDDILCEHGSLKPCNSKSAQARRRVMDKQAWKVLKRLYPDSVPLEATGGCLMCTAETESVKKAAIDKKEEEKNERRKPLICPLVRGFYTRGSKGYPLDCIASSLCKSPDIALATTLRQRSNSFAELGCCPLKPGVYCALPRSWCYRWRKYIKTGEGGFPPPPDGSEVLCEAHALPLPPPHLENFLLGETTTLLGGSNVVPNAKMEESVAFSFPGVGSPVGYGVASSSSSRSLSDSATLQALRAAGLSESELHAQRVAMARVEDERVAIARIDDDIRRAHIHDIHQLRDDRELSDSQQQLQDRALINEQLDRENRVVVEILTDDEITALEGFWPRCHFGTYALRFAILEDSSSRNGMEIEWGTSPCRECDSSSRSLAWEKMIARALA